MSSEWNEFVKDSRTPCKYGAKCYQKNPEHHKTFKHPPPTGKVPRKERRFTPYRKNTIKLNDNKTNEDSVELESTSAQVEDMKSNKEDAGIDTSGFENQIVIPLPEDITYYDKESDFNLLKELFLVEMPSDFLQFYHFLKEQNKPIDQLLSTVNLQLIGPYDLLLGKLPVLDDKDLYLVHWRFFYDPPELQAIIKRKGKSQFHIGYLRDDPSEKPVFLASNDPDKDYNITPVAENIFAAVYLFLQNEKTSSPFVSVACQKLMEKIKKHAEEQSISLDKFDMKKRLSLIKTKTFHGAGIVVPYNKKTQLGYRPLVETDAKIRSLFTQLTSANSQSEKDKVLSELQPVITYSNIAVDECDFGTGLEAGIALFCSGLKDLEESALNSLTSAYNLLNRTTFSKIIQVHLKYRRKGAELSILSKTKK